MNFKQSEPTKWVKLPIAVDAQQKTNIIRWFDECNTIWKKMFQIEAEWMQINPHSQAKANVMAFLALKTLKHSVQIPFFCYRHTVSSYLRYRQGRPVAGCTADNVEFPNITIQKDQFFINEDFSVNIGEYTITTHVEGFQEPTMEVLRLLQSSQKTDILLLSRSGGELCFVLGYIPSYVFHRVEQKPALKLVQREDDIPF